MSRAATAFTASAGARSPRSCISSYERVYPFGWLGVLVDQPPLSHELVYVNHERGFALCSMRSATRSRYYLQCRLDEHVEDWPDEKFYEELSRRVDPGGAPQSEAGAVDRKEHRAAAQLRRRADALRPSVPGRRCRAYRAADRRQGPESRRQRRLLSLAKRSSSATRRARRAGLDAYAEKALARVWKAERFSWWMTQPAAPFPGIERFRPEDPGRGARLSVLLGSRADSARRELCRAAVLRGQNPSPTGRGAGVRGIPLTADHTTLTPGPSPGRERGGATASPLLRQISPPAAERRNILGAFDRLGFDQKALGARPVVES